VLSIIASLHTGLHCSREVASHHRDITEKRDKGMSEAPQPSTRVELEARLAALKTLNDTYTLEKQAKDKQVKAAIAEIIALLDATPIDKEAGLSNTALLFMRGKALSSGGEYSKEADQHLCKAIKLEPSMVQVHNLQILMSL
jgi:hypothetical protein